MSIGRKQAATLAMVALLVGCTGTQSSATPSASASSSEDGVGATASASAGGSANEAGEQVFRDFIAAINSGDETAAAALLSPDASIFGQSIAFTGPEAGIATFVCAADIVSVDADGDELTVELEYTGTAPLAGNEECEDRPAGRHRVTVQDGLITKFVQAGSSTTP